jgi:hypothetical protein
MDRAFWVDANVRNNSMKKLRDLRALRGEKGFLVQIK